MSIFENKNAFLAFLSILLLFACGPSQEEISEQEILELEAKAAELRYRSDLATVTCNILDYSQQINPNDAIARIKEINSARKLLGEDLYIGDDQNIKFAIISNLCIDLVLNEPLYNMKKIARLSALGAEQERAARKARADREKEAEEAKIATERPPENIPPPNLYDDNYLKSLGLDDEEDSKDE